MKAKQMAERASERDKYRIYYHFNEVDFMFNEVDFKNFCDQLCKEQREQCVESLSMRSEARHYPQDLEWFAEIIRNAPKPEE